MYLKLFVLVTLIVTAVPIVKAHDGHEIKPAHQATEEELTASYDVPAGWPVIDLGSPAIRGVDYPSYVYIELVDAESGEPVTGLIRFFTENGQRVIPQSLLPRSTGVRQDHYGIAVLPKCINV